MPPVSRHFKQGQYLFHEGDASKCMYLIKRGTVAIQKRRGDKHVELARIYTNEVLGELSFFDRRPRSASAVATSELEVMEITFESLDKIWAGVPDYMKSIMAAVAERLRKANEQIRKLQKGEDTPDFGQDEPGLGGGDTGEAPPDSTPNSEDDG